MKRLLLFLINLPDRLYNYVILKRKRVIYPKDIRINGRIRIHGSGQIKIGNHVTIHSSPNVNPSAGGSEAHFSTGTSGELIIGSHTGISHVAITAWERIVIGEYVLSGSNCMIADTDFHSLDVARREKDDGTGVKTKPVVIEDHVFIGARSIILKGVTIGENSIVGAGSVVTKSIPANEIWAGNPARFIRKA